MSKSRLVPYVDIPYKPEARRALKRSAARSLSSPELLTFPPSANDDLSPRKRRKVPGSNSEENHSDNLNEVVKLELQTSPTASEFELDLDSATIPPNTRSPSFPDDGTNRSKSTSRGNSRSNRTQPLEEDLPFHTYDIAEDDVDEDEDLLVLGESPPDEEVDCIPVRMLSDFAVYDSDTMQLVSIAELLLLKFSSKKYRASGYVRPWVDMDSENSDINDLDEENDSSSDEATVRLVNNRDRVSLSFILELNLHAESESKYRIDPKMYIRTQFAWYILETPSNVYRAFFAPFWLQHHFLHLLIVASLDDARITYPEFIKQLSVIDEKAEFIVCSDTVLGRELEAEDIESDEVLAYVMSNLPDVCSSSGIKISRVPLIREIMGATHYEFDINITGTRSPPRPAPKSKQKHNKMKSSAPAKARKQGKTFLTEVVNRIAKDFFDGSLEVAESNLKDDDDDLANNLHHKGHYSNPEQIVWGEKLGKHKGLYETAVVDGVEYSIGEVVMVAPDAKVSSTAYSVNKYANRWWFCQIRYFFEEESRKGTTGTKMFHGLWFSHGSKTLLQETSHSKALYLLGTCDNNPVTAIIKKCNFRIMQPGDDEVLDDGGRASNDFHCGLFYDNDDASFSDLPSNALETETGCKSCFACDLREEHSAKEETKHPNDNTLIMHGITYHVHDCVYIIPSRDTKLLDIGQIISIDQLEVHVHLLGRYDDYIYWQKKSGVNDSGLISDERRLFFTNKKHAVPLHKLDGICYVKYLRHVKKIEKWVQHNDHYYLCQVGDVRHLDVMPQEDFSYCETCYLEDLQRQRTAEKFTQTNSKLVGFELFSGAGGLGVGMDLSGFVETKYAIEFSPSAAKTYIENHPETTVYCQDSSALLKHAVMGSDSKEKAGALLSLDGKTYCPPLPDRNEQIDFIFGGPPCQSFSHANHTKRQDDIRSTMPCNMLSYVEYYNPTYFLLENVFGFLTHKFYSNCQTESGAVIETEIQMGMAKFILRTLIALGYQVRFKVLQAAQYGVPQSRRRVIFWGAKRGVPLPTFPIPIYAYEKGMHKVNLPTGDALEPQTRSQNPEIYHQYAPLRPVTVDAAIGDLPKFDWANPHYILPSTKQTRLEEKQRRDVLGISSFRALFGEDKRKAEWSMMPGFPDGAPYSVQPQNRFQKWVRRNMKDEDGEELEVSGQYTTRFNSRVVEATCTVPLEPGACHRDLPESLLPAYANKKKRRVFYGRMDANGFFKCAVTQLSPLLKDQWPLHPSQKRIITVRECARCQGFPDSYIFESVDDRPAQIIQDQLKQIGNAVAVPFALALGKELGKAMILAWEKKEREGSVPL